MNNGRPVVSVIIPCRNEESFLDACLAGLAAQDIAEPIEILVAEGRSTDGTRRKLLEWQRHDPRIRIIDNPEGIVSTGLNRGIRAARGDIVVRADVHTTYAEDYLSQCVSALKTSGADNVGGPWHASGRGRMQQAIAYGFQSPFSSGGARSHATDFEGFVDSVYLGCWRRQTLLDLGLFDEELVRNQDDELNLRINLAGGKVWQTPKIRSWYYPRATLRGLFRQYFQYGYWKIRVLQKHRRPASWRHVIPGLALAGSVLLLFLGAFVPWLWNLLAVGVVAYLALSLYASVLVCLTSGDWRFLPVMPLVFLVFHLSYGAGSLMGLVDFIVLRRSTNDSMTQITR